MTANSIITTFGYTCSNCRTWVPAGAFHSCNPIPVAHWPQPTGSTCGWCGQHIIRGNGWHFCADMLSGPAAFADPAPPARPESPLAGIVTGLCDLLGKAADWLAKNRL